jgi:protein tyrosine/serine phosphatase
LTPSPSSQKYRRTRRRRGVPGGGVVPLKLLKDNSPAARARRRARQERWRGPLVTAADRRSAWASLMLADHGVLRLAWRNRHLVTPLLWRSAQPAPADIAFARRAGIRTVLSLRSDGFGGDALEREACAKEGIRFERLLMWSRRAPPKETLRRAIELFPRLETPVLMHCKSGADRAGLGAALWLIIVEGRPATEAARQLALRYGHVAQAKTGILDAFVEAWRTSGEARGLTFAQWVETAYDPKALVEGFRPNRAAEAFISALRRE